ncbi:MAG: DUF1499 domain-containing protein [Methylococcaceae bacterium]|nr:DUF1499 domain-containing protein [Methylococcaceae bacterium]
MKQNFKQTILIFLLFTLPVSVFSNQKIILNMKLKQCPNSPNCVSSQSDSKSHYIEPLSYKSSDDEAMQKIKKTILTMPRTKLVEEKNHYLHVEFKSSILRFVDDVEIIIDDSEKVIHFRSASRVGHSDFGANRRRINEIKKLFLQ